MSELARFFMTIIAMAFLHWLNESDVRSRRTMPTNSHLAATHS